MRNTPHLLLLLGVLLLASCGDSKISPATGSLSSDAEKSSLMEKASDLTKGAIASVEKLDWNELKGKLSAADLSGAKKALEGVDLKAAETRYDELVAALGRKDYVQAEFYARKLDELLASETVGKSIEFLKVESEKGTDAAILAVKEYLATPGLTEASRHFGEKMLGYFQSLEVNREQVEGVLFWATYYVVYSKVPTNDTHLKEVTARLAASAIPRGFHAYDLHAKEGVEPSEAVLRSLGTNKDEAAKAWNEIVQAGKKGVDSVKEEIAEKSSSQAKD